MRCPFLREEQVKSCRAAPFRMTLARSTARVDMERCSSPEHASCPVAGQSHEAHPSPGRCPFLQESLVQFCAATPRPTYVPWSSSPELRCAHGGHRFCDLFLSASGSPGPLPPEVGADDTRVHVVDEVPMPGWMQYAPNHLWLDTEPDGLCHVGIDAFVVQLVGQVERLAFLTLKGSVQPAVVLTVRGVDLTLVFPAVLSIVTANTRLRSTPERLTASPYGRGWLFQARLPVTARAGARSAPPALPTLPGGDLLRSGPPARDWMAREVRRVSEMVHARLIASRGERLVADGGRFAPDLLAELDREEILRLFAELFPIADFRRTSS